MAEWMARRDSAGQISLIHDSECVVDCCVSISRVGNTASAQFQIPKIGNVCACSTTTSERIAKWIAREVSAHRICLGGNVQCPVDCGSNASRVGNARVAVFKIPKIGDVYACSSTTTGHIVQQMPHGDSRHLIGLVRTLQRLAKCGASISNAVNLAITRSEIPKIGNVCACSNATTGQIAKWIARGVSAHRVGL